MNYILFWHNSIYSDILILFEMDIRHILKIIFNQKF